MAIRLAVLVPVAIMALTGMVIALLAATGAGGTGLGEDQRPWFFLFMPPLYLLLSIYVSSVLATWAFGSEGLPGGMRRWIERARPSAVPPRTLQVLGVAIEATVLLLITVPVYALLAGWLLRAGLYAPWERLMVAASLIGTAVWLAVLSRSYRRARG